MGSGCTSSNNTGKCFQSISSNCVKWQGEAIPALGICVNDTNTEVETIIIERLLKVIDGTGIDISNLELTCDFIKNQITNKDRDLATLLQILIDSSCTLKELIVKVQEQINIPVVYNTKCLNITTTTTEGIVQALIIAYCALQEEVNSITSQLNNTDISETINNTVGNYLSNNLNGCGVAKTGSGANTTVHFFGAVPPFCPIPYLGSLSNFNSSGLGLAGTCYENWVICNGNNGTQDMRGYGFAGAINLPGVNSATLDAKVDPTLHGNDPDYNTNVLTKKGEVKHKLTVQELPAHNHALTDPGHTHTYMGLVGISDNADDRIVMIPGTNTSSKAFTGITIAPTGSSIEHENRQPTIYGVWIMRLS